MMPAHEAGSVSCLVGSEPGVADPRLRAVQLNTFPPNLGIRVEYNPSYRLLTLTCEPDLTAGNVLPNLSSSWVTNGDMS